MAQDQQTLPQSPGLPDGAVSGAAKYMVGMFFVGYTLNFMDRQIVSVLLEAIKEDLQISDGRLGLLTGLAFAAFYASMAVPIAWLSDRYNRKRIIAACMVLWSAATAAFGLAQNFTQMLLARMAVGVGEAGYAPAGFSMIADYFPREKRATATAIGAMGAMLGQMLGLVLGGFIVQHYGWRAAMLIAGLPGVLFALLFLVTVREPRRGMSGGAAAGAKSASSSFLDLGRNAPYLFVLTSAMATCLVVYACLHWLPSYLIRSYGLSTSMAGLLLGPTLGGVGALSLFSSGYITDHLAKRDARWGVWLPALGALLACPLVAAAFLVNHIVLTLGLFGLGYYCAMFFSAPSTAMIQYLVPLNLRARATAVFLLLTTLIGFGLGPVIVGYLSQGYESGAGIQSLRWALITVTPVFLLSPLLLIGAGRRLRPTEA